MKRKGISGEERREGVGIGATYSHRKKTVDNHLFPTAAVLSKCAAGCSLLDQMNFCSYFFASYDETKLIPEIGKITFASYHYEYD